MTDNCKDTKRQKSGARNLSAQDQQYLNCLRESEIQAIDQFDKMVLALAGGAFGVSFAFLKDIVGPDVVINKVWLILAWSFWCLTLLANLTSFYFSHLAMRGAQRKYYAGERDEAELRRPFGNAVMWLNPCSAGALIVGLFCMSVFVTTNLHDTRPPKTTAASTATTAATITPATTATNSTAKGHTGAP